MSIIAEGVRPNCQRDLLAGFQFASAEDMVDKVKPEVVRLASDFELRDVTCRDSYIDVAPWQEFSVSSGDLRRNWARYPGRVAVLELVCTTPVTFETESGYTNQILGLEKSVASIIPAEQSRLANFLVARGRRNSYAQQIAQTRIHGRASSHPFLLDNDGRPKQAFVDLGLVQTDRAVDLDAENEDDTSPRVVNSRDVMSATCIRVTFEAVS